MELAFLPIAAILLLLSGVSAPAQTLSKQAGTAALMHELLGSGSATHLRANPQAAAAVRAHRSRRLNASFPLAFAPRIVSAASAAEYISRVAGSFDQKQFRTRFGLGNGAYFATAPPSL